MAASGFKDLRKLSTSFMAGRSRSGIFLQKSIFHSFWEFCSRSVGICNSEGRNRYFSKLIVLKRLNNFLENHHNITWLTLEMPQFRNFQKLELQSCRYGLDQIMYNSSGPPTYLVLRDLESPKVSLSLSVAITRGNLSPVILITQSNVSIKRPALLIFLVWNLLKSLY